jgi:hypothetical protein
VLFPLLEDLDWVVSVGTGESRPNNEIPTEDTRSVWKNGAVPRLCRLFWEKMRDRKVKQMHRAHPRYHRLNLQFEGGEPRLDSVMCMPEMRRKAQADPSLDEPIATVARAMVASLFYFELDAAPELSAGRYNGKGKILCALGPSEPGFRELFRRMSDSSAQILVNDRPVSTVNDPACFDKEGNFRKPVDLDGHGSLGISLREASFRPSHISGSPFTVERLVLLQGLDAVFGRRNLRKGWPDGACHRRWKTHKRPCNRGRSRHGFTKEARREHETRRRHGG